MRRGLHSVVSPGAKRRDERVRGGETFAAKHLSHTSFVQLNDVRKANAPILDGRLDELSSYAYGLSRSPVGPARGIEITDHPISSGASIRFG